VEGSLRGKMTKRYCDECRVLKHRDESRIYQRNKKNTVTIITMIKNKIYEKLEKDDRKRRLKYHSN
jgi:hypothetical protein